MQSRWVCSHRCDTCTVARCFENWKFGVFRSTPNTRRWLKGRKARGRGSARREKCASSLLAYSGHRDRSAKPLSEARSVENRCVWRRCRCVGFCVFLRLTTYCISFTYILLLNLQNNSCIGPASTVSYKNKQYFFRGGSNLDLISNCPEMVVSEK